MTLRMTFQMSGGYPRGLLGVLHGAFNRVFKGELEVDLEGELEGDNLLYYKHDTLRLPTEPFLSSFLSDLGVVGGQRHKI